MCLVFFDEDESEAFCFDFGCLFFLGLPASFPCACGFFSFEEDAGVFLGLRSEDDAVSFLVFSDFAFILLLDFLRDLLFARDDVLPEFDARFQ